MKNLFYKVIIVITFLSVLNRTNLHGQSPGYVQTPRETNVLVDIYSSDPLTQAERNAIISWENTNYPNATRIANPNGMYNCHSYAWHEQSTYNNKWMNDIKVYGDGSYQGPNVHYYWTDGSYSETDNTYNEYKITYKYTDGLNHERVQHSGFWTNNKVQSKWGNGSIMKHNEGDCPYTAQDHVFYKLAPPPKPGSISGPSTHCVNNTETYSVSAVPSAESYQWNITSPGSIVGSGSNRTVNITSSSTGTSYLKVRAANGAGYGPWSDPRTINFISCSPPPTPGTIYYGYPPWIGHCVDATEEYWISSVSGATSYVWEASGSLSIDWQSGTSADVYASNTNSGTLRVKACNSFGCSGWRYSSPNPIYPVECEGGGGGKGFSMAPNPADDFLEITIEENGDKLESIEEVYELKIYNSKNVLVYQTKTNQPILRIDTKQWTNGVYFVHFVCNNKKVVKQLIISH